MGLHLYTSTATLLNHQRRLLYAGSSLLMRFASSFRSYGGPHAAHTRSMAVLLDGGPSRTFSSLCKQTSSQRCVLAHGLKNLAVFVSGGGSNLQQIHKACSAGHIKGEILVCTCSYMLRTLRSNIIHVEHCLWDSSHDGCMLPRCLSAGVILVYWIVLSPPMRLAGYIQWKCIFSGEESHMHFLECLTCVL